MILHLIEKFISVLISIEIVYLFQIFKLGQFPRVPIFKTLLFHLGVYIREAITQVNEYLLIQAGHGGIVGTFDRGSSYIIGKQSYFTKIITFLQFSLLRATVSILNPYFTFTLSNEVEGITWLSLMNNIIFREIQKRTDVINYELNDVWIMSENVAFGTNSPDEDTLLYF